jgi:hypothetical protein
LSSRSACSTAIRASAIFCPPIDPDRSNTRATLTGARVAREGASGAVSSTSAYRTLPPGARMRDRSARTVSDIGAPWLAMETRNCVARVRIRGRRDRSGHGSIGSCPEDPPEDHWRTGGAPVSWCGERVPVPSPFGHLPRSPWPA